MGQLFDFVSTVSGKLGIPAEILSGLPVLEITGDAAVLIEKHRGICSYSEQCVSINVNIGHVIIHGQNLMIQSMNAHTLILYGKIKSIALERATI